MAILDSRLVAAFAERYDIERELGRGATAIVYLVRDLKHARRVALKVLRPELAHGVEASRFLREIKIASQLTHPNILPLYDWGETVDGQLYYVTPFIEGETLRGRLARERQLPIDDVVDIARQVATALDYAHRQRVIHRDIKPENLLLLENHILLADFGIARGLEGSVATGSLTATGAAIGTPVYMSPEQAGGEEVDGRSDIYSLGCVVYEMIAGVPPFRGATARALLAQHATAEPQSLCEHRTSCPLSIDSAVRRAMAKVPADRFGTAGSFAAALVSPRDMGWATDATVRRFRARVPHLTMSCALTLSLIVAVSLAASYRWSRAPSLPRMNAPSLSRIAVVRTIGRNTVPETVANDLTRELFDSVTAVPSAQVVPLDSVTRLVEQRASYQAISTRLRAGTILECSLRRQGATVIVTIALADGASGGYFERRDLQLDTSDPAGFRAQVGSIASAMIRRLFGIADGHPQPKTMPGKGNPAATR